MLYIYTRELPLSPSTKLSYHVEQAQMLFSNFSNDSVPFINGMSSLNFVNRTLLQTNRVDMDFSLITLFFKIPVSDYGHSICVIV